MKKFKEIQRSGFVSKWYFKDENKTVLDMINDLKSNEEISINYIQVDEDVELDAKLVAGNYSIDSFLSDYEKIRKTGSNPSYKVIMKYNDLNVSVDLHEASNLVVLSTPEPSLEIDDLIQKKTDNLTF